MLRLPPFTWHRPATVDEAVALLAELPGALPVAGGTDLIPNMKHRLFEPAHLVALRRMPELVGIHEEADHLVVGAAETLAAVARHPRVRSWFPALAEAAGNVAGPQLRSMGTIGGNLCLDTRCTYYNQTAFWREALGYCLKKDGDVCHVTRVGKKCVAAHSADTPPVLITLGATAELRSARGSRELPVDDFFVADGIWNSRRQPGEVVTRIRIPLPPEGLRTAWAKLRQRKSIDFPLFTVAVAAEMDGEDRVSWIRGVATGLGSRPRELTGWQELAGGEVLTNGLIDALAERAHAQCHPLENLIADPDWRRAMVPVFVRKALRRLVGSVA